MQEPDDQQHQEAPQVPTGGLGVALAASHLQAETDSEQQRKKRDRGPRDEYPDKLVQPAIQQRQDRRLRSFRRDELIQREALQIHQEHAKQGKAPQSVDQFER